MTLNDAAIPDMYSLIASRPLVDLRDIPHQPWPQIEKVLWTKLGDALRVEEQKGDKLLLPEKWLTLRLDLRGFSKMSKRLFKESGGGFNKDFALAMQKTMRAVMKEVNATYGFTQSDEITVILPTHYDQRKGVFQQHPFNGKRDKLVSLTASFASVVLAQQLTLLNLSLPSKSEDCSLLPLVQFDCRAAMWDCERDAFRLIMWRAYDCTVNSVSDAIFKSTTIPNRKEAIGWSTIKKLELLQQYKLLPLHAHQSHGVFVVKRRMMMNGVDPRDGTTVQMERGVLVEVDGNLLVNLKSGEFALSP